MAYNPLDNGLKNSNYCDIFISICLTITVYALLI